MRPVRAAAPSPGHRPGFFMDAKLTPCKGKSFLNVFKAFALTGRFADYQHYPGRCPGLGASALSGREVQTLVPSAPSWREEQTLVPSAPSVREGQTLVPSVPSGRFFRTSDGTAGDGGKRGKVLFTFLPFYPFTFKMFKHRRLLLQYCRQTMSCHLSLV